MKIRSRFTPSPVTVKKSGETVTLEFLEAQKSITPGQAAVFYDGDTVVGGGWIDSVIR